MEVEMKVLIVFELPWFVATFTVAKRPGSQDANDSASNPETNEEEEEEEILMGKVF